MSKALQVFRRQIREGQFDDQLDEVLDAVAQTVARRRVKVRATLIEEFTPGVRVRTVPGAYKPRYFANRVGTVTTVEDGRVWIELDTPILRQRGTIKTIGMHGVEYLERVDE